MEPPPFLDVGDTLTLTLSQDGRGDKGGRGKGEEGKGLLVDGDSVFVVADGAPVLPVGGVGVDYAGVVGGDGE